MLGVSQTASAQEWLKDRRQSEGAGIRVGNLELHPGIGGEIGYDSNYFLRTSKDGGYVNGSPDASPVATGELRITPSFSVNSLGAQRLEGAPSAPALVAFRASASATYREFLSGNSQIRDQRNLSADANVRADFFQSRPLGFGVWASYQRLIQPSVQFNPDLSFNQDNVTAGGEVVAIPGGGTFDVRAGYQFSGSFYEESNGVPYTNTTHELSVRTRWKFRPRTALFHDTTLRFISYPNADRSLNYLDGSTPLRTRIGLTGLLTDRFGVLLAAGYGASFFQKPTLGTTSQYDSLNAQAEGTVYLSRPDGGEPGQASLLLSRLVFGFTRDFSNSLLANYYTSDKGYLRVEYFFAGRALISLEGYFEALAYPQPYYQNPTTGAPVPVHGGDGKPVGDFTNYHVGGILYGEYRFTNAFALTATLDYSQMISDTAIETGVNLNDAPVPINQLYQLSWTRFQALLGARLFF